MNEILTSIAVWSGAFSVACFGVSAVTHIVLKTRKHPKPQRRDSSVHATVHQ